jgi:hypothetical protein
MQHFSLFLCNITIKAIVPAVIYHFDTHPTTASTHQFVPESLCLGRYPALAIVSVLP